MTIDTRCGEHDLLIQSMQDGCWQRMTEPVLSTGSAGQDWCRVMLYTPRVIRTDGLYRMWFIGGANHSRSADCCLGYAESDDGIKWRPYEGNPIATPEQIPWGMDWNTPYILFDEKVGTFRMWFTSTTEIRREENEEDQGKCLYLNQALGYAESKDGIDWDVHPEPVYWSGRSPSVLKNEDGPFVMWAGSRPDPESPWDTLYHNIYRFTSPDGIHWIRSEQPVVLPSGEIRSCVYPCVVKNKDGYLMIHGGHHVKPGTFELYGATSVDGIGWNCHHDTPVLHKSGVEGQFDGRFTSTPSILIEPERLLLYYSARPLGNTYIDGQGKERIDRAGVYNAIGVAILPLQR